MLAKARNVRSHHHVVGLFGGLGNQLFQYCWACWLQARGEDVRLETRLLERDVREYGLGSLFTVDPAETFGFVRHTRKLPAPRGRLGTVGTWVRRAMGPGRVVFRLDHPDPRELDWRRPSWWYGYWQVPEIVDHVLLDLRARLSLPPSRSSVLGIHVRRGDFVPRGLALPASYFASGVRSILSRPPAPNRALVFSDDPDWCRRELQIDLPFEVMDGNSPEDDLMQLAACGYLLLSHGTFSWWAARLVDREAGRVLIPEPLDSPRKYPAEPNCSGIAGVG